MMLQKTSSGAKDIFFNLFIHLLVVEGWGEGDGVCFLPLVFIC